MTWRLRDGVSWAPTEYGGVLLDGSSGEYWTLNRTGAVVLACLLDGAGPTGAAHRLTEEFAGEPDTVAGEVPTLVGELESAGLVVKRHDH